jgi:RecB family endonuclease NucS
VNITDEKRKAVIKMIRQGRDSHEISARTGLPVMSIAGIRTNHTRGRYSDENVVAEALETTFGLEGDLQHALRVSIEQLEPGLEIVDGGTERSVASGRIDITAEDRQGAIVVIELKAGKADRDAIAQVLSYMGDVAGSGDKQVRGILVAGDFSARALSAARAAPHIELKKYSYRFSFESADA